MKRHFSFLLLLLFSALSASAQFHYDFFAPNQRGDTLYYQYDINDSDNVCIVNGPKAIVTDTLFIPIEVKYNGHIYTVTEIGNGAFGKVQELGSFVDKKQVFSHVVIPEGIRKIGTSAFVFNDSLQELELPSSCIVFEEGNGSDCPKLKWLDCSHAHFPSNCYQLVQARSLQYILPPRTQRYSDGSFGRGRPSMPSLRFMLFPDSVELLWSELLSTTSGDSQGNIGDTAVPFVFLSLTPPSRQTGLPVQVKRLQTIVYYPCGADTAYQHSWMNKYKLKPSLFLENGYKKLDSVCPAKCYRAYGFRPDSVGVWIVKKKSPNCDCDSLNIYIVRSLLPDATVNDSSINVEPNREDTSVVWTWEGTGVEYDVYREEQKVAVVTEPYYRDTDIMPGVQYCYNFVPINAYGCEGEWSGTNCYTMVFDDGIGEHTSAGTVTVRPNPATGRIFIDNLPEALQGAELVVYDATGREVLRQDYTPAGADVSALSRGIYFLRIGSLHGKFVKM